MDQNIFPKPMFQEDPTTHIAKKGKSWKASELETLVLKHHFQKNQCPTTDDKESIQKIFKLNFSSEVKINQLTRWFKNQREMASKANIPKEFKKTYQKFAKEELDSLHKSFADQNYPNINTMKTIATGMNVNLSKIENWYKHNRRMLAKHGNFSLKTKKYFKKDELSYLINLFDDNSHPASLKITEIAEKLSCDKYQIKNWFSNRRKSKKLQKKAADLNKAAQSQQYKTILQTNLEFESENSSTLSQSDHPVVQTQRENFHFLAPNPFSNQESGFTQLRNHTYGCFTQYPMQDNAIPSQNLPASQNEGCFQNEVDALGNGFQIIKNRPSLHNIPYRNFQLQNSNVNNPNYSCFFPQVKVFPQIDQFGLVKILLRQQQVAQMPYYTMICPDFQEEEPSIIKRRNIMQMDSRMFYLNP